MIRHLKDTAMNKSSPLVRLPLFAFVALSAHAADGPLVVKPTTPTQLCPLAEVRLPELGAIDDAWAPEIIFDETNRKTMP